MKKIFIYVIIILFTSQFIKAQTGSKSNNKNNIEDQGLNNTVENKNSETRGSYWLPASSGRGIYYNVGMVGIGTDNPTNDLDVAGTISATGLIFPGGNIGDVLTYNSDGSAYWAPSTGGPSLWSVVTQGIVYNPLGLNTYVGIGVASPDEKLHVNGTILTEGGLKMLGNTNQIVFGNEASSTFQIARNLSTRGTSPPPEGAQVSILKVDANNNVGIGTTNPGVKLDVNGTIRTNNDLLVNGNTSINTLQINSGSCLENFIIDGKTTTNTLQINTGSCQQDYVLTATDINGNTIWKDVNEMNIESAWDEDANGNVFINEGNVGIGTSAPMAELHVDGTTKTDYLQLTSTGTAGYVLTDSDGSGTANWTDIESIIGEGLWTENNGNVFRISGNIGLGIDQPIEKLDINGNIMANNFISGASRSSNSSNFMIKGSELENSPRIHLGKGGTGSEQQKVKIIAGNTTDGQIEFWPGGEYQANFRPNEFTVGFPDRLVNFRVNGKIWTNEIEVQSQGWWDKVFHEDYNLRSIEEVEKFIGENSHLPDIPSEAEVMQNGVNLGEMDGLLLKKIEELTLYIIQQQKEIDGLKVKLNSLETKY